MRKCKDGRMRPTLTLRTTEEMKEDFMSRVQKTDGCWLWRGGRVCRKSKWQYGGVSFNGKHWKTHRLAFHLFVRPVIGDELICHHCDNPICVNPKHLFAGTNADNKRDSLIKGRLNVCKGSAHGNAKLTEKIVRYIRKKCTGKRGQLAALAKRFGVGISAVWIVYHRKGWNHI